MGDDAEATGYDAEAVRAKYLAERDKRLVPGRADIRDLAADEHFARYRDDPFTPRAERAPVADEVDVVIVGGGHRRRRRRSQAAQGRASSASASSTRPAASAAPGTGTATRG